jgi:hypothetical protein
LTKKAKKKKRNNKKMAGASGVLLSALVAAAPPNGVEVKMMLQPAAVAPFRHMPSGRLVHTLHGHRPQLPDLKSMLDNEAALASKLEGCHNV